MTTKATPKKPKPDPEQGLAGLHRKVDALQRSVDAIERRLRQPPAGGAARADAVAILAALEGMDLPPGKLEAIRALLGA